MQVAAAGRAADHVALNDGNRGFADRDGPADERLVGASLGRAAAALVRDLVRDDARGGRDDGDVEVAPLVLAAPRVGLRAVKVDGVLALADGAAVPGGIQKFFPIQWGPRCVVVGRTGDEPRITKCEGRMADWLNLAGSLSC